MKMCIYVILCNTSHIGTLMADPMSYIFVFEYFFLILIIIIIIIKKKVTSSMARSLPVENLLPQKVGSIINYFQ